MTTFASLLLASGLSLSAESSCLTEALYHEARSEGYSGMVAVGLVVKHRVLSPLYPNSICEVIEQPYQFSYKHELDDLTMHEVDVILTVERAAEAVLSSSPTPSWGEYAPTSYHTTAISPYWADSMVEMFTVGNHVFYTGF